MKGKVFLLWVWSGISPVVLVFMSLIYLHEVGINIFSVFLILIVVFCLVKTFDQTKEYIRLRLVWNDSAHMFRGLFQRVFGLWIPLTIFSCLVAFLYYAARKELTWDTVLIVVGLCLFLIGIFMALRARISILRHHSLGHPGFLVPFVIGLLSIGLAFLSFSFAFLPSLLTESIVPPIVILMLALLISAWIIFPAWFKLKKKERDSMEDRSAEESQGSED